MNNSSNDLSSKDLIDGTSNKTENLIWINLILKNVKQNNKHKRIKLNWEIRINYLFRSKVFLNIKNKIYKK